MHKKAKILTGIGAVFLIVGLVAAVLFFPLTGEKHVQVWSADQGFDIKEIPVLEKNPEEDFKILLLADIQLWSNPGDNKKAYAQIKELVERTKPDFITTVGDNVSGATSRFLVKKLIQVMDSFQIPWTVVYGNHDSEIPMTTLNWQADQYMAAEYCMFQKGPSNLYGSGNHVINVTEGGYPIQSLFFFDNGRYFKYEQGTKEIYMGYEQIAWYEWNVKGMAQALGKTVPSMTFSHFAQPEFAEAVAAYGILDEATGRYTIPSEYGSGSCAYLPGTAPVKSGFFDKCLELGSTKYIFCGHDHENDASVTYQGITMTYGLKTGPSPAPWNNAERTGGTLITIGGADTNYAVTTEHIAL